MNLNNEYTAQANRSNLPYTQLVHDLIDTITYLMCTSPLFCISIMVIISFLFIEDIRFLLEFERLLNYSSLGSKLPWSWIYYGMTAIFVFTFIELGVLVYYDREFISKKLSRMSIL